MKKVFFTMAAIALLSALAIGCQKVTPEETTIVFSGTNEARMVIYSINGAENTTTLNSGEDWSQFLNRMIDLSEEGCIVKLRLAGAASGTALLKEVVTFSTPDREVACAWVNKMVNNGYEVTISYDKENQLYHCSAVSNDGIQPNTDTSVWHAWYELVSLDTLEALPNSEWWNRIAPRNPDYYFLMNISWTDSMLTYYYSDEDGSHSYSAGFTTTDDNWLQIDANGGYNYRHVLTYSDTLFVWEWLSYTETYERIWP